MAENGVARAETVIEGETMWIDKCGETGQEDTLGFILESLQFSVFAEGWLVAVSGTPVAGHGIGLCAEPFMAGCSPSVFAEGYSVCRVGHKCTCGGSIPEDAGYNFGCDSVFIGED